MKVALIQCPGWGRDCPPYTLALLSAWLRHKGHEAFVFDLNNTLYCSGPDRYKKMWDDKDLYSFWNNESLIREFILENEQMIDFQVGKILDTGAGLIGFTIHFTSLLVSLEVARRIKSRAPEKIICFGGPDCYRDMKGSDIINHDPVDIVATGEGDRTLLELAEIVEGKGKVDFCKGTIIKKDGVAVDCGDRPVIKDLDATPFADYSDFGDDITLGHYQEPRRLEILDSRGCVTCCHFCSEWQFWKSYRTMSGRRIFEEVAFQMKKYPGVNYFYFNGSLVNGDPRELSRFCDLVIENNLQVKWSGQAVVRPEMTQDLLSRMRQAGCEWLGIGIESASQKVRDNVNKHFSNANAEEMLRYAHESGIITQANIMFGIPSETEKDFQETLEFLKNNRKNIDSVLASQSFCVIDKGTYLHTHAKELGIKDAHHHLYWEARGNDYPTRQRRYEDFCRLALSLGLPETSGVLRVKPDKWLLLGDYHLFREEYPLASGCYKNSLMTESADGSVLKKLELCHDRCADNKTTRSKKASSNTLVYDASIDVEKQGLFLGESQKSMFMALRKHGLDVKADNLLLVEKQKSERHDYLAGYPYWLALDPNNSCPLKCPFCPTGQGRGSRAKGKLSFEDCQKVLDILGPYLIHIDFCNWGEPLLNKDIARMIAYAKKYRVDTKVDSNLNYLTVQGAEDLVSSGLDKLIVSLDGTTEEAYSKYRVGGDFSKVMRNLKLLLKKKKELKTSTPYISWQFLVFRHNEHQIEEVERIGKDLGVDHIGITKAFIGNKDWIPLNEEYSNYKKEEISGETTSEHFKTPEKVKCNWPWEAIAINPNGSVSPCCSVEDEKDDFDNILKRPFHQVWNNEKYRAARRYIRDGGSSGNGNICIGCRHSGMINLDILSCHSYFKGGD